MWGRIPLYKEIWENAAMELNAGFIELAEGVWEVRYGDRETRLNNHLVQLDDPVVSSLAAKKDFCYSMLEKNGLPIPEHLTFRFDDLSKVKLFMEENGGFFVIKPARGTSAGLGVTTHITSFRECLNAIALASLHSHEIIIERLVPGECYRILILNGEIIHASRRRGLRVRGDGQSTIGELLIQEKKCFQEFSGNDSLISLKDDRDITATLEAQRLTFESAPGAGQGVIVRSSELPSRKNVEVRTVYNENVTGLLCQDLRKQAVQAAQALNSRFAGVDIITLDPSVTLEESRGVINEINTTPGLQHHYNLLNDHGTSPAVQVLKYLLDISNDQFNDDNKKSEDFRHERHGHY